MDETLRSFPNCNLFPGSPSAKIDRYYRGLYTGRKIFSATPFPLDTNSGSALYAKHEYRLMNAIVLFSASIC